MFRIIRKWYFKLYHLFRFLGIFILIFGIQKNVYAEECNNLLDLSTANWYTSSYSLFYSENGTSIKYIDSTETSFRKTYTFFFLNNNESINDYLNEYNIKLSRISFKPYSGLYKADLTKNSYTFTQSSYGGLNNLSLEFYSEIMGLSGLKELLENGTIIPYIIEGDTVCTPTPDTPEENNVYTNFLTLYTDRLNYLAEGTTNNPYLIAMIGIIFAWVVLELFLKILHLRGGYHK